MNNVSTASRNQTVQKSTHYAVHRVLISAAAAGIRAGIVGMAAMSIGRFHSLLLRIDKLLTRVRAWIKSLLDHLSPRRLRLLDRRDNEIQKLVLLRFVLRRTATESARNVVDS